MATFTIDLLTGELYLFSGDFGGSGSTSGSTYPEVEYFNDLPPAIDSAGQIYIVLSNSGTWFINRHDAGLYYSNGTSWVRLGDTPSYFSADNFRLYKGSDQSTGIKFNVSNVDPAGTVRTLTVQNSDGTIAYLTDLNTKVDLNVFSGYTGTTAPATFLSKTVFNVYSGDTLLLINDKQDKLTAGTGISLSGTTISIDLPKAMQLSGINPDVNVNNIIHTAISWVTEDFSGTALRFTGGSRIYIEMDGIYGISYILNVNNDSNSGKNIGTVIRKNGNTDITPMSSASLSLNYPNDASTNIMPENLVSLVTGDYIELVAFRIGFAGEVYTLGNGSWIKIQKMIR